METTAFGRYQLQEQLDRRSLGQSYRAFDTSADRVVALRLLPEHMAHDKALVDRFHRELSLASRITDAHMLPIHDFGEIDGRLFVDMRMVEGRDLHAVLADGPLEPSRAVKVIEQVAAALGAAHALGLVHRDVKLSSILVAEDDFVYLTDFGMPRGAGGATRTDPGHAGEAMAYMAPEQFTEGVADARTDTYSLTCVLYECLTGEHPFRGESIETQIAGHLTSPPPHPSEVNDEVPPAFDAGIAGGMAKDPKSRYQTASELAEAARTALNGRRDTGPRTAASAPHAITPPPPADEPAADPSPKKLGTTQVHVPTARRSTSSPVPANVTPPAAGAPPAPANVPPPAAGAPPPLPGSSPPAAGVPTTPWFPRRASGNTPAGNEPLSGNAPPPGNAPPSGNPPPGSAPPPGNLPPSRPGLRPPPTNSPPSRATGSPPSSPPRPLGRGFPPPSAPPVQAPPSRPSGHRAPPPAQGNDRTRTIRAGRAESPKALSVDELQAMASAPPRMGDNVDISVFAPRYASRGHILLVQVLVYQPAQLETAATQAVQMDRGATRRGPRGLDVPVETGAVLAIDLSLPGLDVVDPIQTVRWTGRSEAVQFEVFVPERFPHRSVTGTVTVNMGGLSVGHISWKLPVDPVERADAARTVLQGDEATRYSRAFISYAAADRPEVLRRMQMLRSFGVNYFEEVLELDPGDRWERELYRQIENCDVFLLFWSREAKRSAFVRREVDAALGIAEERSASGTLALRPVLIEGPPVPPPWPELSHLHFNDRLLYVMN